MRRPPRQSWRDLLSSTKTTMPSNNKEKLKEILQDAAISARKHTTERVLEEAAKVIQRKPRIGKEDLREIGESIANDKDIFATIDIEDINNVLDKGRGNPGKTP